MAKFTSSKIPRIGVSTRSRIYLLAATTQKAFPTGTESPTKSMQLFNGQTVTPTSLKEPTIGGSMTEHLQLIQLAHLSLVHQEFGGLAASP